MRKIAASTLLIIISFQLFAQEKRDLGFVYLEKISGIYDPVREGHLKLIKKFAYEAGDKEILDEFKKECTTISEAKTNMEKMFSHGGDSKLKKLMLNNLDLWSKAYNNDYKKAINTKFSTEGSKVENEYNFRLGEKDALAKIIQAEKNVQTAFDDFIKEYNVPDFQRNQEINSAFNLTNSAYAYGSDIYFRYFTLVYMNSGFMSSLNSKNSVDAANKRDSLMKESESSMAVLKSMDGYSGDNELKDAAYKFAKFYKSTAEKDYVKLEDLMKRYKGWTATDAEDYNSIIGDYKKSSGKYYSVFNDSYRKFLELYIPKE